LTIILTIFYMYSEIHLINKSVSFHGKHQTVWVTPNFWTGVLAEIEKTIQNILTSNSCSTADEQRDVALAKCFNEHTATFNQFNKTISLEYSAYFCCVDSAIRPPPIRSVVPNVLRSLWGVPLDRAYRKNPAHHSLRLGRDDLFQNPLFICGTFMMQFTCIVAHMLYNQAS